jgi:hypothetical protein
VSIPISSEERDVNGSVALKKVYHHVPKDTKSIERRLNGNFTPLQINNPGSH